MASLTIRALDDDVKTLLRARATGNGRSMAAEARDILRQAVGCGASRCPEPSPAIDRLDALRHTPGAERRSDAVWPSERAFDEARAFAGSLPRTGLPAPSIGLADDGEVNFLWKGDGVHIDLGFYGTGVYSYFARGKDGQEYFGENVPAATALPDEITALFGV